MRVELDLDRCCGTGQCALTAPELFEQSEETGLAVLRTEAAAPGRWDAALLDAVRQAAENCPVRAIRLIGNQPSEVA